jgi:undecaprenyl-diphosphatase
MDPFQALVLGVIQGISEWLPISSSGHLAIAEELLGLPAKENLLFDLFVHLGTLFAVCTYFRKEIVRIVVATFTPKERRGSQEEALRMLGLLILVATVPIAVLGVLVSGYIQDAFNLTLIGMMLVVNAGVLFFAERRGRTATRKNARFADAIVIGLFQAVAILPGISRSGSTISGGMFRGIQREMAATFAFLLSVPAILGAFLYGLVTLHSYDANLGNLVIGLVSAFLMGLASIEYLLKAIRSGRLWLFSIYCAVLGVIVVLASL